MMKALIFAAGLGTRLRPFTLHHPKALARVGEKPVLQLAIEHIAAAGISDITVNIHHFGEQIIEFLDTLHLPGIRISISDERSLLLDTGGGLAQVAATSGCDEPFLVYNADIVTNLPLRPMLHAFAATHPDALLLATPRASSRQLYFSDRGRLLGWENLNTGETRPADFKPDDSMTRLAFGGIHIVGPRLLALLADNRRNEPAFPVIPFYLNNLQTLDIQAYTPAAPFCWHDIGRPETLEQARACPNHRKHEK